MSTLVPNLISNICSSTFLTGLGGAAIGGVITGLFSLWAVHCDYKNRLTINNIKEQTLIKNFLQSLSDEISVFWTMYQDHVENEPCNLNKLENDMPFEYFYKLEQNYFVVYDNNTHLLGSINEEKLTTQLITFYLQMKNLIGTYDENNNMLGERKDFEQQYGDMGKSTEKYGQLHSALCEYAQSLKKDHNKLSGLKSELLKELKSEIDCLDNSYSMIINVSRVG